MSMSDPGYDDTDMTPEEFEACMAEGTPADISPTPPPASIDLAQAIRGLAIEAAPTNQSSGRPARLNAPAFASPPVPPDLGAMAVSQA